MDLTLKRNHIDDQGVFGVLLKPDNTTLAVTLEHAYAADSYGHYAPKVPVGTYTCKRSSHRLHGMTSDFETFQVMNVPGHDNILFHWGNFNKDSEGCILLGQKFSASNGTEMITDSKSTWAKFMDLQKGVDTFILTIG